MPLALLLSAATALASTCSLPAVQCAGDRLALGENCGTLEVKGGVVNAGSLSVSDVPFSLQFSERGKSTHTSAIAISTSTGTKISGWGQDLVDVGGDITYNEASQYFEVSRPGWYWMSYQVDHAAATTANTMWCWADFGSTCSTEPTPWAVSKITIGGGLSRWMSMIGGGAVWVPSTTYKPMLCCRSTVAVNACNPTSASGQVCWVRLRWHAEA